VILGVDLTTAIIVSAIVVTVYTMVGGMWSVAYTDVLQLGLVVVGLAVALPYALGAVGGFDAAWTHYANARPDRGSFLPPASANATFWTRESIVGWWDVSLMLVFGGIPWNCYFQRVLSCQTPARAQWHSILSGLLTIALTAPPLVLGVAAFSYAWTPGLAAQLQGQPADTLPLLLKHAAPPLVALLGMGAIIGAVTSSFSSSILSAGSMFSWNTCKRLLWPALSTRVFRPGAQTSQTEAGSSDPVRQRFRRRPGLQTRCASVSDGGRVFRPGRSGSGAAVRSAPEILIVRPSRRV
jgi:high affinity choline transporter 7